MTNYSYHPLHLSFYDMALERKYIHENDASHLVSYRTGLVLAYMAWFGGIFWSYFIVPQHFIQVLLIAFVLIFPLFGVVLRITYIKPLPSYFQKLIAFANFLPAIGFIYIYTYLFQDYQLLSLSIALLIMWAHFIIKLRFKIAMLVTFSYTLLSQIIVLVEANYTLSDLMSMSMGFWLGMLVIGLAGYYHEKDLRISFVQGLLLEEQKQQIIREQEKSEKLLLNILPEKIASRLKNNTDTIAERFEEVSVLFADIANFTKISAEMKPKEVVSFLNDLFVKFDRLTEKYGLEKIKTIGDAYMVVAGIPEPFGDHAERMLNFSLEIIQATKDYNKTCDWDLNIRIGINSGPAVAGIIGEKKFQYDIWGDTVNTASRMESHGLNGKILVSENTYHLMKAKFDFEAPHLINVKGKGQLTTYFLKGRDDSNKQQILYNA